MTTDTENDVTTAKTETPTAENATPPKAAQPTDEAAVKQAEIEWLIAFKKENVRRGDLTPCPSCTTLVEYRVNHCPHCDSNIAAHNALIRESLRRLDEINGDLDGRHERHQQVLKEAVVEPTFWERVRGLFSKTEVRDADDPLDRMAVKSRILHNVSEGDHLKVVDWDGPWFKVKTRNGHVGWVYSTIGREPSERS